MPVSSHKNSYDLPKKGDIVKVLDRSNILGMLGERLSKRLSTGWQFKIGEGNLLISDGMLMCCGGTYNVLESDDNDDTVLISEGYWFPMCMVKIV
jgi:hypothetical protein